MTVVDVPRALQAQALAAAATEDTARELLAAGVPAGLAWRTLTCTATLAMIEAQGIADPEPIRAELEEQLARVRNLRTSGEAPNVVALNPADGHDLLPEMAAATETVAAMWAPRQKRRRWFGRR